MARVIVLYETVDGQTRKIADRIAARLGAAGHEVVLVRSEGILPGLGEEGEYDGAVVCGPVYQGEHPSDLIRAVRENRDTLAGIPNAFVSVSLATAIPSSKNLAEAGGYVERFIETTGWAPDETHLAAGALRYTEMDYLKRLLMRMIVDRRGGQTESGKDYEYTDWEALESFADRFASRVDAGTADAADD